MSKLETKEAIEILSELHDQCCQADSIFCTDVTGARCEAVDMAITALEKQIPKKIRIEREHPIYGYASFCPNCNRMDVGGWSYCPDCGQAITME